MHERRRPEEDTRRAAVAGLDGASSAALEQWFSSASLGFAIVDPERRVRRMNPALARLAAAPHDGSSAPLLEEALPALACGLEPIVARALDRGEAVAPHEIAGSRARGAPPRLAACFPLRGDDGSVHAAGLALWDVPGGESDGAPIGVRSDRLALAMEGTGTGFWEWDAAEDRFGWSESLDGVYGLDASQRPRRLADFLDLIEPGDRAARERRVREATESRSSYVDEFRIVHPDGEERWIASRAHVVSGADGSAALVGLMADVTDRRRREDALTFLAEAGEALAASLDPLRTMDEIARLAVPRLADWCAVQLASDANDGFENVAVAHVDPDKVRWARALEERYPPDPDAPTGAPAVIRSGRSELYPEIDDALLRAGARNAEHLELIRRLRMSSAMVVPMRARGRTLGAITFIFAESGRQYSTSELALAEELGRRAGLALDHARLYDREHRTAETLQRALLPPTLPHIEGHELAARYLPGGKGDQVGGDWYDAFALPDGRVGIAIGDIGGRGITAAALMGQVRNALRAYAIKADGAGAAMADLRMLDESLDELVFATLSYLVYDPRSGEMVLSNAGHLPGLLIDASGAASYVDATPCPPLGAGVDAGCHEHGFTLEPGATLVLYTDGLVESRDRSLDDGMAQLAAVASASRGDVQRLADEIVTGMPDQREDDVALLALRRLAG